MTRGGTVQLGMPQLSGIGLSETWLLERCGEIHWELISQMVGFAPQDLRDGSGQRVYSSFIALAVSSRGLDLFREGDALQYSSQLTRRSRTRFESTHTWVFGSETVEVRMLSVFLRRKCEDRNDMEEPEGDWNGLFPVVGQTGASDLERAFREQKKTPAAEAPPVFTWLPTLSLDFNGARLLYFARYHQIVERAERTLFGETIESFYALEGRRTYYFANVDAGEAVSVSFSALADAETHRTHEAEIHRVRDGKLIARIVTRKKRVAAQSARASERPRVRAVTVTC